MGDTYTETRYEVEIFDPHKVEVFDSEYEAREFLNQKLAAGEEAYLSCVVRVTDMLGVWTEKSERL